VELRGFEPRTEPGEMALELRFLSFGVVTRVLRLIASRGVVDFGSGVVHAL
jgi:hypothetical protein